MAQSATQTEIQRRTGACQGLFIDCLSDSYLSELEWLENRQGEFNLWAVSFKAASIGKSSLDYRVRRDTEIRDLICDLLDGLAEALEALKGIAKPTISASELELEVYLLLDSKEDAQYTSSDAPVEKNDAGSSPSNEEARGPFLGHMFNIKTILGQLTRVSTAIRRSGGKYRHKKADASLKEEDFEDFRTHLTVMIHRDRIKTSSENGANWDTIRAQITDPNLLTPIQKRLLHANILRRNRIIYDTRKTKPTELPAVQQLQEKPTRTVAPPTRKAQSTFESAQYPADPIDDGSAVPMQTPSRVAPSVDETATDIGSQIDRQRLVQMKQSTPSVVTRVTHTATTQDYPSCPKPISHDWFQCPYCADFLQVAEYSKNKSRWRGHVAQDILPYMCIYDNCETPNDMYSTSDELFKHMRNQHYVNYWVCTHCASRRTTKQSFVFELLEEWESHMKTEHKAAVVPSQLPSLAKVSQRRMLGRLDCPLCGYTTDVTQSTLDGHIAQHLHGFALRCLPSGTGSDENDSIITKRANASNSSEVTDEIEDVPVMQEPLVNRALASFATSTFGASHRNFLPDSLITDLVTLEAVEQELGKIEEEPEQIQERIGKMEEELKRVEKQPWQIEDWLTKTQVRIEDEKGLEEVVKEPESEFLQKVDRESIQQLATWITREACRVFLITTWCGFHATRLFESMIQFQRDGFNDSALPIDRTSVRLLTERPSRLNALNAEMLGEANLYAFYEAQWKFLVPVFSPQQYNYNLSSDCILPFTLLDPLPKAGAFSVVYRVRIHEDHKRNLDVQDVALKELKIDRANDKGTVDQLWEKEATVLEAINGLNHSHIIKCIAAIRNGNSRYFMFPWADGDSLRDFWEGAPMHSPNEALIHQAIRQLRGLADALDCLHHFGSEGSGHIISNDDYANEEHVDIPNIRVHVEPDKGISNQDNVVGSSVRHGNLKPENILRFANDQTVLGVLKMADMSLAERHVVGSRDKHHLTTTRYDTVRYEAPEIVTHMRRSRLYDIWTMGCITLDFTIWLLYGNIELGHFYNQIRGDTPVSQYFEIPEAEPKTPQVHRVVLRWMNYIQDTDPECLQDSAIRDLLKLVREKLLVVPLPPSIPTSFRDPMIQWSGETITSYRATAAEFREALDNILSRASRPGYLLTAKDRSDIKLPSDSALSRANEHVPPSMKPIKQVRTQDQTPTISSPEASKRDFTDRGDLPETISRLPRRLTQLYSETKSSHDAVVEQGSAETQPELNMLHRKYRIQKDRLIAWGLEWSDNTEDKQGDIDESVEKAGLTETVTSVLDIIKDILSEAERMRPPAAHARTGADPELMLGDKSDQPSDLPAWTASEKSRYEDLAKDLTNSIDILYDLSRSRRSHREGAHSPSLSTKVDPEDPGPDLNYDSQLEEATYELQEEYNDSVRDDSLSLDVQERPYTFELKVPPQWGSDPTPTFNIISDAGEQQYFRQKRAVVPEDKFPATDSRYKLQERILRALQRTKSVEGHDQEFLPRNELQRLINLESVSQELKNELSRFHTAEHIMDLAETICKDVLVMREDKRKVKSFRKIFALLVMVENVASISQFLNEDVSDLDLPLAPVGLSRKGVLEKLSRGPLKCFDRWSPIKLRQFQEYQWMLLAPFFSQGDHGEVKHFVLRDNHVLPFIALGENDDEHIKFGGYSKVFIVQIHKDHHDFPNQGLCNRGFAIKQLYEHRNNREVSILKNFSGQRSHEHVISLLATYEQFKKFHLIFYRAEGNLFEFWRVVPHPTFDLGNILWIAKQCAGISGGLLKLHKIISSNSRRQDIEEGLAFNYDQEERESRVVYGRHGDITPSNILWFNGSDQDNGSLNGILKIADFGQAEINSMRSRSRQRDVAYTVTYRPPECDLQPPVIGQSFDIWCLGCVYLEFVAWALGGNRLYNEFARKRQAMDAFIGQSTDTFYETTRSPNTLGLMVMIKPAVTQFISELHQHPNCTEYFHEFLNLIENSMLVVDPSSRMSCEEIHKVLRRLLQKCLDSVDYVTDKNPYSRFLKSARFTESYKYYG